MDELLECELDSLFHGDYDAEWAVGKLRACSNGLLGWEMILGSGFRSLRPSTAERARDGFPKGGSARSFSRLKGGNLIVQAKWREVFSKMGRLDV